MIVRHDNCGSQRVRMRELIIAVRNDEELNNFLICVIIAKDDMLSFKD